MFRVTKEEIGSLGLQNMTPNSRSQFATLKRGQNIKYLPCVFTKQGMTMLSSVLNSNRAILVNIHIMRVFVNLRRIGLTYVGLKRKIESMERKYDIQFKIVFDALKKLLEPPPQKPKLSMGFRVYKDEEEEKI